MIYITPDGEIDIEDNEACGDTPSYFIEFEAEIRSMIMHDLL